MNKFFKSALFHAEWIAVVVTPITYGLITLVIHSKGLASVLTVAILLMISLIIAFMTILDKSHKYLLPILALVGPVGCAIMAALNLVHSPIFATIPTFGAVGFAVLMASLFKISILEAAISMVVTIALTTLSLSLFSL